jgi:predicted Rossmann fold flavoprotein
MTHGAEDSCEFGLAYFFFFFNFFDAIIANLILFVFCISYFLFTFELEVPGKKKKSILSEEGPLLITHRGISGPSTLRLSAFAAREFHLLNYKSIVYVHWAPELGSSVEEIEDRLWSMTTYSPKKLVSSACPLIRNSVKRDDDGDQSSSTIIPRRLWSSLVKASGFEKETIWAEAPKKKVNALARNIAEFPLDITGKSVFKDEFVTAGGVMLKEITMKTMESKKCQGLYFCGEVIDVDGVTGGFNFMNCWR